MVVTRTLHGGDDGGDDVVLFVNCFVCKLFCFKFSLENILHRASLERSEGNARLVDRQVSLFSKFQTETSQLASNP